MHFPFSQNKRKLTICQPYFLSSIQTNKKTSIYKTLQTEMLKLKYYLLLFVSAQHPRAKHVTLHKLCNSTKILLHFLRIQTKQPKFTNPFCFLENNHTQKLEKQKHNTKKTKSHTHFASYYDSFQVQTNNNVIIKKIETKSESTKK